MGKAGENEVAVPFALTLSTAKPFSSLRKVTRSISPERLAGNAVVGWPVKTLARVQGLLLVGGVVA
jgi:hypothetical protein